MIDLDGNGTPDYRVPDGSSGVYYAKGLIAPLFFFMMLQLTFAALFLAFEDDWDYGRSVYHCFVTATTVGYGDVPIRTQEGKVIATIHILLSVSLLAAMISDVDGLRQTRRNELKRGRQFLERINVENVLSLDVEGNGVDRFEFVVGMLIRMDAVDPADVQQFIAQFDALNCSAGSDGDGTLTREELERYADQQSKLAASNVEMQRALNQVRQALGRELEKEEPQLAPPTPLRSTRATVRSPSARARASTWVTRESSTTSLAVGAEADTQSLSRRPEEAAALSGIAVVPPPSGLAVVPPPDDDCLTDALRRGSTSLGGHRRQGMGPARTRGRKK